MAGDARFDELVARLHAAARADRDGWARDGWARAAAAVAETGAASALVTWASDHRRWHFVVAEAAQAVCAKPAEAATWIAHAIVDELLEDDDVA